MATALDQIVNINISASNPVVPQAGFGIPLIVGPAASGVSAGTIKYFTDPADYVTAGGSTSDTEYKHLVTAFSQALSPTQVGVGTRTAAVAQVDTMTVPTVTDLAVYNGTLNGVAWTFTAGSSTTAALILAGIKAAIDALAQPVTTLVVAGTSMTTTANVAGNGFAITLGTVKLANAHTTPNHGIADDLATLQAYSNLWYGLDITSSTDADILEAASYIETQKKIFFGNSNSSSIYSNSTTDVASLLQGLSYKRTAILATKISANLTAGMGAGWLGGMLPYPPGSATYKFKQLVGVSPDSWSSTERAFMIGVLGTSNGKNANIYETVGSSNITEEGKMAGGQFIDMTVGIDWFESTMQTNIFAALVEAAKVPYTDEGAAIIGTAIWQTIGQAQTRGFVDASQAPTVFIPLVASQSEVDRGNRYFPGMTFSVRGAGAIHGVQINGTVTV